MENLSIYIILVLSGIMIGGIIVIWLVLTVMRSDTRYRSYSSNEPVYQGSHGIPSSFMAVIALVLIVLWIAWSAWHPHIGINSPIQNVPQMTSHPPKQMRWAKLANSNETSSETVLVPSKSNYPPVHSAYYLQLDSFMTIKAAKAAIHSHSSLRRLGLRIAVDKNSSIPYKLLIGPFKSAAVAHWYLVEYELFGFLVSGKGWDWYMD